MRYGAAVRRRATAHCFLVIALLVASPAVASPDHTTLSLKPLLGWAAEDQTSGLLLATICSDRADDHAVLRVDFGRRPGEELHEEPVRVPAAGCAHVAFSANGGRSIAGTLVSKDGRVLARARASVDGWWHTVVVLDTSLKGLVNGRPQVAATIAPDVSIPPNAMDWACVSAVVTRDRSLSDQRPDVRRAVEHFISRGGVMLVVDGASAPDERRGGGTVYTTTEAALVQMLDTVGPRTHWPVIEPGDGSEVSRVNWDGDFAKRLLEPVDPNTRHAPRPWISWVILLAYVALVGPLSYRFFARRGRPVLSLCSVPASAACMIGALFGHGAFERGLGQRSSSLAFAEVLTSDRTAALRRIAGLVTTRPGRLHVIGAPGAFLDLIPVGPHAREHQTRRLPDGRTSLETRRVGLWDTVFVAEGSFVDLGGTFEITPLEDSVRVENRTRHTLRDAVLREVPPGQLWPTLLRIGTLGPGAVLDLPRRAATLGQNEYSGDSDVFTAASQVVGSPLMLQGTLEAPLTAPFEGFQRDAEPTTLRVVRP